MTPRPVEGVLLTRAEVEFIAVALTRLSEVAFQANQRVHPAVVDMRDKLRHAVTVSPADADAGTSVQETAWFQDVSYDYVHHEHVDTAEAARIIGCSAANVRDLCRRGVLPSRRSGHRWLPYAHAVQQYADYRRRRLRT